MKSSTFVLAIFVCIWNCLPANAADFDGSKPFTCSPTRVVVCEHDGNIEKDTAEDVNLPKAIVIDVAKKILQAKSSSGETRETAIEKVRHENGTLILEGVQLGKAWHAVINEQTGKTTITGATDDTAFVVFAACTLNSTPASEGKSPEPATGKRSLVTTGHSSPGGSTAVGN